MKLTSVKGVDRKGGSKEKRFVPPKIFWRRPWQELGLRLVLELGLRMGCGYKLVWSELAWVQLNCKQHTQMPSWLFKDGIWSPSGIPWSLSEAPFHPLHIFLSSIIIICPSLHFFNNFSVKIPRDPKKQNNNNNNNNNQLLA